MRIALLAALPQEYRPFMKRCPPWRRVSTHPHKQFLHVRSDREILLVETGMGRQRIEDALKEAIRSFVPDLLISFGFVGSLHPRLGVGELCFVEDFARLDSVSGIRIQSSQFHLESSTALKYFCRRNGIKRAAILTGDRPEPKAPLVECLHEVPSLLDMESYHAARLAMEEKIPFLCFRSVSDGYRDEIDFDLDTLTDAEGQIQIRRVVGGVIQHPGWMKSFWRAWKRSKRAGERLADGLTSFLNLPLKDLQETGGVEMLPPGVRNQRIEAAWRV